VPGSQLCAQDLFAFGKIREWSTSRSHYLPGSHRLGEVQREHLAPAPLRQIFLPCASGVLSGQSQGRRWQGVAAGYDAQRERLLVDRRVLALELLRCFSSPCVFPWSPFVCSCEWQRQSQFFSYWAALPSRA
jgi:hypothetical protein